MNRWILVLFIAVAGVLYLSLRSKLQDDDVPREKLSSIINTDYQEVRPLISPDGKTLYFSRRNHPENTGGDRDYQDIWVSNYENGTWSAPVRLSEPLNNKKTNTLCSITSDGKYALLLDSYKKVKSPLAQAYDSPAGWGAPGDLLIDDFTNLSSYYDFYYQEQQQVLLSAIDDGRGYGEQDLHVSFRRNDGSFTKPQNLGSAVNSSKSDFAPFLSADGNALYFASFGHEGMGGSDFYVSYRLDDSWKRWTEPKNLGPGINSEHDENYLSITADFKYVYFESYPQGAVQKDIYRAQLPRQFHPENLAPNSDVNNVIADATYDPAPQVGSPVKDTSSEVNGGSLETKPDAPVLTTTTQASYPTVNQSRSAAADISGNLENMGKLSTHQYFKDGQVRSKVLKNSYFPFDSYQLSKESFIQLNEIANILQTNPSMEAQVEGHSDSWGSDKANLRISYLRALSAAHYLIDQGIAGNRLLVTGNGEKEPLASNDDEIEGRELNRRVEVTLFAPAGAYRFILR